MSDITDFNDFTEEPSVLVLILRGETKESDSNVEKLKELFSDPYFIIHEYDPHNKINENKSMAEALTFASEGPFIVNSNNKVEGQFWWQNIPCIIVKDSSVSTISSVGMKDRIKTSLDNAKQADLFFLCKWQDDCNKYIDVSSDDHDLKWSSKPTATQAIMYTPKSRDHIRDELSSANTKTSLSNVINKNISDGNLLATVFVPNIVHFDINLATSNDDYAKLNECAPISSSKTASNEVASYMWLGVMMLLVILVAWFIIEVFR